MSIIDAVSHVILISSFAGNGKMTSKNTRKESKMETAKKSSVDLDRRKTKKKLEGKKDSPDSGEVGKASFRGSPMNSGDRAKTRKGKVKEFVKMFNQEVSLNTKGFDPQSRNVGGKVRGTSGGENIDDASKTRTEGTARNPNEETEPISDTPAMVIKLEYFVEGSQTLITFMIW